MKFVTVRATNFLSFKELDYDFKSHPVLIQGENLTEPESQKSNGSGKTTIQCAIEYALLTTTSRKVRDAELVFWGEVEASVYLEIHCPMRKQSLIIERNLPIKGSSRLELTLRKGEEDLPVDFSTVADGNKYILDWVDLSKEDIQNFYIVNKERYTSFFSSPNAKKIELISRFSNSYMINGVDRLVQEDVVKLEKGISQLELNIASVEGVIKDKEDELLELNSQDFEEEKEKKIQAKEEVIEGLKNNIEDIQKLQEALIKENEEIADKITGISLGTDTLEGKLQKKKKVTFDEEYEQIDSKLSEVNKSILSKEKEKKSIKNQLNEVEEVIDEINKNIKGAVVCPKCSHEFLVGDPDVDIEEEKKSLVDVEKLIVGIQTKLEKASSSINVLNNSYQEINKEKTEVSEKEKQHRIEVREIQRKLDLINDEVAELSKATKKNKTKAEEAKTQEKSYLNQIDLIKEQIVQIEEQTGNEDQVTSVKEKIELKTQELVELTKEKSKLEGEHYKVKQWVFNFKKFYGHLANKSLKVVQGYCNKYLGEINSDLQIKWEGFKMKGDGTLSEKITPYIMRAGEMKDFWSFSGGERARLDFAMILTIQGIINSSHKYGGICFLSLDEVMEGIDDVGLSNLMKSLKNMDKTILLTTHVTDRNTPGDILLVKKINGVSTLN